MLSKNREIVTGRGLVPATDGYTGSSWNVNLLNMIGSGFSSDEIAYSHKVAGMRLISDSVLRVAIAEFGFFRSTNLLVLDIDLTDDLMNIRSIYQKMGPTDLCSPPFTREILSVNVLRNGEVVVAGRDSGFPFLMKWNGTLQSMITYAEMDCSGELRARFHFGLPIFHPILHETPASYSILQDRDNDFICLVTGVRAGNNLLPGTDSYPAFAFVSFNSNDLSINYIDGIGTACAVPYIFEPGYVRSGLVGSGDDIVVQFSGLRRSACAQTRSRIVLDGIIRTVDGSFNTVQERNYKNTLGLFSGTGDITAGAGCVPISGLDSCLLRSETVGLIELDETGSFQSANKCVSLLRDGKYLYSLELTRQGHLALILYNV